MPSILDDPASLCKNIFLSLHPAALLQRFAMRRRHLQFSDAFARVLQRLRVAKKLSKQELAAKAGLHQTYIGKIESGLSNPSLDAASSIAEALGVPLSAMIVEAEAERQHLRT
jgi:DNA-binding XRE family transcriptional regulator